MSVSSFVKLKPALSAALALFVCAAPHLAFETELEPAVALGASGPHVKAPSLDEVNLFPAQSYESLGGAAQALAEVPPPPLDTPPPAPVVEPPPPPPETPLPFSTTATWRDRFGTTYVVDGLGKTFLFCTTCRAPGAVHPGEQVADGYRLKTLDDSQAVLVTPDGKEKPMPLMSMAH